MPKCKACGAELVWAVTERGQKIPLDKKTTTVFVLAERPGENRAAIAVPGHLSHFATCTDPDRFRKPR